MVPLLSDAISVKTIYAVHECEMLREYAPETVRKLTGGLLQQWLSPTLTHPASTGNDFSANSNVQSKWYVMGGEDTQRLFMQYDVEKRRWTYLPALPWKREDFSACVVDGRIIAMGGFKNSNVTNDIDEYDLSTKTWTASSAKLSQARKYLAVCSDAQQQHAYAIGGDTQDGCDCSVFEKYSYFSKQIERLDNINLNRSRFTAALANDRIYVAGDYQQHKNVEAFDISKNKWSNVGRLSKSQWDFAGVTSGDNFYLMGGKEKYAFSSIDTVQIFNIRTGQSFVSSSPLTQARHMCCATTLENGNVICVVGGIAVNKTLNTVECYDKREGKWTIGNIVPNLLNRAFSFGFAVHNK